MTESQKRSWIGVATLALIAVFAFQSTAQAQARLAASSNDAPVTYSADVASIINENCAVCHRAGGIGPMELVTYELDWYPRSHGTVPPLLLRLGPRRGPGTSGYRSSTYAHCKGRIPAHRLDQRQGRFGEGSYGLSVL
jgi:hypothetical protein